MGVLCYLLQGFIIYVLALFLLQPQYLCVDNGNSYQCTADDTCSAKYNFLSNGKETGYYINWDSNMSLKNWVYEFDLRCKPDWMIGMFASSYFIGHVFGNLLVRFGDTVGRIRVIRVTMNISIVIFATIIFISRIVWVTYGLLFLLGFFANVRSNLAFIYGQEIVGQRYQYMFGSLYNIIDGSTMIFVSIYFMHISKEWLYLESFCFGLICIAGVLTYIMPESPRYLASKGDYEGAIRSFNFIAKFNGRSGIDPKTETIFLEQHDIFDQSSLLLNRSFSVGPTREKKFIYSFSALMTKRIYFVNLITLNIIWSSVSFTHYMIAYYIKYIPGDLYTNVISSAVSEVLAYLFSGLLCICIGTKSTFILSFVMGAGFGIPLMFLTFDSEPLLIMICVLLTKFGISCAFNLCYLVTAEYFPLLYSSSVFGACNLVARITTILAPMVAEVAAPYPMLIYCSFCVVSLFATFVLKKENDKKIAVDRSF